MHIPDGYTEDDVIKFVKCIVNRLIPHFKFGYYDNDDLFQEGMIWAIEALPKYDKTKSKLSTFLTISLTRKFINLRRDRLYRMPPSCSCPSCMSGKECPKQTERMESWRKINTVKRNLMNVNHMGDDNYEDALAYNEDTIRDIVEIVDENLDVSLREDYRRMVEGASITKKKKDKVVEEIHRILKEVKYEI